MNYGASRDPPAPFLRSSEEPTRDVLRRDAAALPHGWGEALHARRTTRGTFHVARSGQGGHRFCSPATMPRAATFPRPARHRSSYAGLSSFGSRPERPRRRLSFRRCGFHGADHRRPGSNSQRSSTGNQPPGREQPLAGLAPTRRGRELAQRGGLGRAHHRPRPGAQTARRDLGRLAGRARGRGPRPQGRARAGVLARGVSRRARLAHPPRAALLLPRFLQRGALAALPRAPRSLPLRVEVLGRLQAGEPEVRGGDHARRGAGSARVGAGLPPDDRG